MWLSLMPRNVNVSGLIALGVGGPLVLSFIVFLCSFVPVIGVFISTLPMAVAALGDYGVSKVRASRSPNSANRLAVGYTLP